MCFAAAVVIATSRAVVDRAGREVPAVEVAADKQHRRLGIAPRHFGNDIARMRALGFFAHQRQVHRDRLPALEDANQLLGIGDRKRAGRDGLCAVGEILHAGVRVAVMVGADRAHDDADRAFQ